MSQNKTAATPAAQLRHVIVEAPSLEGFANPTLRFEFTNARGGRWQSAVLYRVAAELELASAKAGADWVVVVNTSRDLIALELATGAHPEVGAALTVLREIQPRALGVAQLLAA
jgi:hypothetical protein